MSVWKLHGESSKIHPKVLAWTGLNDVATIPCYHSKINHQLIKWFLVDYGINQEDEPFYAFDIFRSNFRRDSVIMLS